MKIKLRTAAFLVVWLAVILLAYYFFFWRYIQPFDHQKLYTSESFDGGSLVAFIDGKLDTKPSTDIVIYHWLNPDCNCLRFGGLYVDKLMRETATDNAQHVILAPPGKAEQLSEMLPMLDKTKVVALNEAAYKASLKLIPATPAAVVYYRKNRSISFLGPHSSGVICGKGTGFVELVLNNLQHGFDPALIELEQTGCFCDW